MGADGIDFSNREAVEGSVSDNGTIKLAWTKGGAVSVELQQAAEPEFTTPTTRYRGQDAGSVLTGLPEGTHWFRLRAEGSEVWSEPLEVKVAFVSRRTLFLLLGIGLVVVVATVVTIISSHVSCAADRRKIHGRREVES